MIFGKNLYNNIAILFIVIVLGYALGISVVKTVDKRLSNVSINMPKIDLPPQNIYLKLNKDLLVKTTLDDKSYKTDDIKNFKTNKVKRFKAKQVKVNEHCDKIHDKWAKSNNKKLNIENEEKYPECFTPEEKQKRIKETKNLLKKLKEISPNEYCNVIKNKEKIYKNPKVASLIKNLSKDCHKKQIEGFQNPDQDISETQIAEAVASALSQNTQNTQNTQNDELDIEIELIKSKIKSIKKQRNKIPKVSESSIESDDEDTNYKNPKDMSADQKLRFKNLRSISRMTIKDYKRWLLLNKSTPGKLSEIHNKNLSKILSNEKLTIADLPSDLDVNEYEEEAKKMFTNLWCDKDKNKNKNKNKKADIKYIDKLKTGNEIKYIDTVSPKDMENNNITSLKILNNLDKKVDTTALNNFIIPKDSNEVTEKLIKKSKQSEKSETQSKKQYANPSNSMSKMADAEFEE